jgi:ferrochelatase
MKQNKAAVLLLAHGSPESLDDVPEFVRHITGGRPLPEAILEEVRYRYSRIGKSPLTEITMAQAQEVQRELGLPVYVGMRNWKPFVAEAVRQMLNAGVEQVLAICLAPQNSSTSVGLYKKALFAEMPQDISVRFVEAWHDHPLLIQAFAEKMEPVWRQACAEMGAPVPVIFTAHSVPTRTIAAGDPYDQQAKETGRLVGSRIQGLSRELQYFAYQSQGMSGGPWLGPTVENVIVELRKKGSQAVIVAPIGFVCDHVDVLYDVDIAFKQFAQEQALHFWRTESLNVSPTFISALAQLALAQLSVTSGSQA